MLDTPIGKVSIAAAALGLLTFIVIHFGNKQYPTNETFIKMNKYKMLATAMVTAIVFGVGYYNLPGAPSAMDSGLDF